MSVQSFKTNWKELQSFLYNKRNNNENAQLRTLPTVYDLPDMDQPESRGESDEIPTDIQRNTNVMPTRNV